MKDAEIRREREKLLSGTDYLLQPDYPLNDPESDQYNPEKIKEIKQFRQALRDITEQEDYPFIELPTLPAGIKLKDSYS